MSTLLTIHLEYLYLNMAGADGIAGAGGATAVQQRSGCDMRHLQCIAGADSANISHPLYTMYPSKTIRANDREQR